MNFLRVILAALFTIPAGSFPALAQHQHGGHSPAPVESGKKADWTGEREASPTRAFLLADGIKAVFYIMSMAEHVKGLQQMKMKVETDPQANHNISVALTDTRTNVPINEAVVKMKVIDPQGKDQIKPLDSIPAMNQYTGDFTLSAKGRYQILILFKAGDQKQAAGFYYRFK